MDEKRRFYNNWKWQALIGSIHMSMCVFILTANDVLYQRPFADIDKFNFIAFLNFLFAVYWLFVAKSD